MKNILIAVVGAVVFCLAALGIVKRLRDIPETPMTGDTEEYYKKYPIFARVYYLISYLEIPFDKFLRKNK